MKVTLIISWLNDKWIISQWYNRVEEAHKAAEKYLFSWKYVSRLVPSIHTCTALFLLGLTFNQLWFLNWMSLGSSWLKQQNKLWWEESCVYISRHGQRDRAHVWARHNTPWKITCQKCHVLCGGVELFCYLPEFPNKISWHF